MFKRKGAISGLVGGTVASLFGIAFLWRVLYLMEVVVAVFQGRRTPNYRPFYTMEQAGGFLLIAGFLASLIILLLWMLGGAGIGYFAEKRYWHQRQVFRSWLAWGMSFAVICLVAFVILFWLEDAVRDPEFLRVTLFLFVWWTVCGLGGSALSAKLFTRWTASDEHLSEPNLSS